MARGNVGVSYYDLLGVRETASASEVKSAYREASKRHHPDRLGTADSHLFVLVGQAYQVLSDPARRAAYDRELSGSPPPQPPPQPPSQPYQAPQPSSPSYSASITVSDSSDTRGTWPLFFLSAVAGGVVYDVLQHDAGGWLAHPDVSTVFGFLTAGVVFIVGVLVVERLQRMFPRR